MKRLAAALLPLLASACTEAPTSDRAQSGTAYIHTMQGILEVDYDVVGDRVVVDDLTIPIDDFFGAVIDEADLDDAIAGGAERAAVRAIGRYRWPGGRIPYRLASDLSAAQQTAVNGAIAHWEANTRFDFVARTTETDFVTFARVGDDGLLDNACRSDPGRSGGEQEIDVSLCGVPQIIHEIGHLVGFYHEHTRSDRDAFVTINWANITAGKEGNFRKYIDSGRDGVDVGTYDYASVMHYGPSNFSKNGMATITPTQAGVTLGNTVLSIGDINAAESLVGPGGEYSGGPKVWLYRDANLAGTFQSFSLGWHLVSRGDLAVVGDNTTSSIGILPGTVIAVSAGDIDGPRTYFSATQNTLPPSLDNAISTLFVGRGVTAYRDQSMGGVSQTFRIGEWRASSGDMSVVGDNAISSLYIPPGLVAELCTANTGGTCQTYEGSVFSLSSAMNENASLIRVKAAATMFRSANFLGATKSLTAGTYPASAFAPFPDNALQSLVVGDGLKATVCTDASGTIGCEVYRGDVNYVGDVMSAFGASWIKIENNTLP